MNLKKIYFFVFFILSYFILSKTIKDDNDDDFEFEFSFNDKKKTIKTIKYPNPYHIFHVAPWSDLSKFTDAYKKLKNEYLYDKTPEGKKKLNDIELAYKKIKKDFDEGNNKNFYYILTNTIISFIFYLVIIYFLYFLSWLGYKIQGLGKIFVYQIIAFILIGNFIPHYFDYTTIQYIVSIIFGLLLYFIFGRRKKEKQPKEPNEPKESKEQKESKEPKEPLNKTQ